MTDDRYHRVTMIDLPVGGEFVSAVNDEFDHLYSCLVETRHGLDDLGEPLTKVDDVNVTLSLSGDPDTSLVHAVQITVGWQGVLAPARGGTGTSTVFTAGSVIFAGASGVYAQDNANLFWDDSNNRLGIGTATPDARLQVAGELHITSGSDTRFNFLTENFIRGVTHFDTSPVYILTNNSANPVIGADSGSQPAVGTAMLVFADGTAPSGLASNTAALYADDVGGTVEQFAINEANELTRLTGLPSRNSAQFDAAATTTLANVTGLTRNVAAGVTYRFEAVLFVTADVVGGSKFAIAGTATATAIIYDILLLDEGTNAYTITSRQTALAGAAGQVGTTSGLCRIVGTIVVNAAGTLTVQFAQNVASGTSSIVAHSSFVIQQVP